MKFDTNKEKGNSGLGMANKSTINLAKRMEAYRVTI